MKVLLAILLLVNVALLLWSMGQREFMSDEFTPGATFHPELMELLPPEKNKPETPVKVTNEEVVAVTTAPASGGEGTDAMATVVLNERSADPAATPPAKSAVKPSPVATAEIGAGQCMYIGPYKALVSRGRAGRQLEDMKVPFSQAEDLQGQVIGYRVYQGPFEDARETSSARRRLERQGVKDLYLVKEGKQQFISLGFFSSEKSAAEFTQELSQKKVVTKQRTEYETNYWLVISDRAEIAKLQKKNAFPLPAGIRKEIRSCK